MIRTILKRRNLIAMLGAVAVTGCVYTPAPLPGPAPIPPLPDAGPPVVDPGPPPSGIALSPGYFNGRDGSGSKIRAQVKRDGRNFRVQSLKGKNGPERLYRDQGGNVYRASNGFSINVSSSRSFYWNGPHGGIVMND